MSFFAEPHQIPEVERRIHEEVLPRFMAIPHFLGFVRTSIRGHSPGNCGYVFLGRRARRLRGDLRGIPNEVERVTGATPARKEFGIVKMLVRAPNGKFFLNMP